MAKPIKVDRDALHAYLWKRTDQRGRITVKIADLADDLGIRRDHMGRILREMGDAGRLKKTSALVRNVGIFTVVDPDEWNPEKPLERKLAWQ